jgi:hypothetical protein
MNLRHFMQIVEKAQEMQPSAAFLKWFGNSVVKDSAGKPLVCYHGTHADIKSFKGMVWASVEPELAHEYSYAYQNENQNIIPLFMRIENPFNADYELSKSVTVGEFTGAIIKQAAERGITITEPVRKRGLELINIIRDGRIREESGPHYSRHDFWYSTDSMFGVDGATAIRELFRLFDFDGVKMVENGVLTYGAFSPSQAKSIYNKGVFNIEDSRISETAISQPSFCLHPSLDPKKYVMTNNLADFEEWKAMTYEGNSRGEGDPDVGKMGSVGYIMISLKDNTIIPMSRSDEHNKGYDTLEFLQRKTKGAIKSANYLPIWSYGNNYIYNKSEVPDLLNALEKFLSYGGPDGVLKGTSTMRGLAMTSRQFVDSRGNYEATKHELAPLGAEVYADLKTLSETIRRARSTDLRSATGVAFQAAKVLVKLLARDRLLSKGIDYKAVESLGPHLRDLQKSGDLGGLEEMFFGFDGVKNVIHNSIREALKDKDSWTSEDLKSVWGDLDLAVDMLGRF